MSSHTDTRGGPHFGGGGASWEAWAVLIGVPVVAFLVLTLVTWNLFFHYVPPGKVLVVIAKGGKILPAGQVLAEKGQKGILKEVLGEGWHYVPPIAYTTELADQ